MPGTTVPGGLNIGKQGESDFEQYSLSQDSRGTSGDVVRSARCDRGVGVVLRTQVARRRSGRTEGERIARIGLYKILQATDRRNYANEHQSRHQSQFTYGTQ